MRPLSARPLAISSILAGGLVFAACTAELPTRVAPVPAAVPQSALARLECNANVRSATITCASDPSALSFGGSADILGGQNVYVKLTSFNVRYDAPELLGADVTVQNLMNEAIGTANGAVLDTAGIKVFFHSGPTVTAGTGSVTIANSDGTDAFTGSAQPFFRYGEMLTTNTVSSPKRWQFNVPATVANFSFSVYLSVAVQPLLVINEVMANPGGTILDQDGEWLELYNAGSRTVNLQGLIVRDSAVTGLRAPYAIPTSYDVAPGAYVVLGETTNTSTNGGVPVDIAYGSALALANSLRAIRLERVYAGDTLTIDGTAYASGAISAKNGISRELKNPALANYNMDGSNWGDASVVSVYGPGGRGTPKAQNSTYIP